MKISIHSIHTYSVIIPHYQDAKRLNRLLKSLPVSKEGLEIIVVDDSSPDQIAMNRVREKWSTVRWLKTEQNAGAGVARNMGLDAAHGHWVVFADSDDEFLPDAFDIFDSVLNAGDQLVYFLAEAVQEMDGSPSVRSIRMNDLVNSFITSGSSAALKNLRLGHVQPVAKVYSRAFVTSLKLRFDPVRLSNDIAFNVLAAVQADNIRAESVPVYRIYRRGGSLTADTSPQALIQRLNVLGQLNLRLKNLGVKERMHAGSYIARSVFLGPKVFLNVLRLIWQYEMTLSTWNHLRPKEAWSFALRFKRNRSELGLHGNLGRMDKIQQKKNKDC